MTHIGVSCIMLNPYVSNISDEHDNNLEYGIYIKLRMIGSRYRKYDSFSRVLVFGCASSFIILLVRLGKYITAHYYRYPSNDKV